MINEASRGLGFPRLDSVGKSWCFFSRRNQDELAQEGWNVDPMKPGRTGSFSKTTLSTSRLARSVVPWHLLQFSRARLSGSCQAEYEYVTIILNRDVDTLTCPLFAPQANGTVLSGGLKTVGAGETIPFHPLAEKEKYLLLHGKDQG